MERNEVNNTNYAKAGHRYEGELSKNRAAKPKMKRVWTGEACRAENGGGGAFVTSPNSTVHEAVGASQEGSRPALINAVFVSLKFGSVQSTDLLYDHSHPNPSSVSLKFVLSF